MPRVSVIVPIYNVRSYLRECLDSLLEQRFTDFEVIMVDDGSTDESPAIAQEYVDRDERFRLVSQANAGLGAARNAGAKLAQGEFLAFLDSDDMLPRRGLKLLVDALDQSGSDFATGNVLRITSFNRVQSKFLEKAFLETRLATHITKFHPLLADRIAPNKLWRRSFWEQHRLEFPIGVVHEDIPVVVPAHFLAKSVDIIADPTYLYRIREGGELSITQRRREISVLKDRVDACEYVSDFLGAHGPRKSKRLYDESVVADDLRYFVNALDRADEDYRAFFLDRVNAYLDKCDPKIFRPLPAIERLKWHMLRQRLMPEFLEVQRFWREEVKDRAPIREGNRWYGDYPYRNDPELRVPADVYELRQELTPATLADAMRWEGDVAHFEGRAWIRGIGAPEKNTQRVRITALRPGRLRRLRLLAAGLRLHTSRVRRSDATALTTQPLADLEWSGFSATITARRLRRAARRGEGTFELYATMRSGRVTRRGARFLTNPGQPVRGSDFVTSDGTLLRIAPAPGKRMVLQVSTRWARVGGFAAGADGTVQLTGELHGYEAAAPTLELVREGSATVTAALTVDGDRFSARVSAGDVLAGWQEPVAEEDEDEEPEDGALWELWIVAGKDRRRIALDATIDPAAVPAGEAEVALHRSGPGDAVLAARARRPVITQAAFNDAGDLELGGVLGTAILPLELVLVARGHSEHHVFPLTETEPGRFAATVRHSHDDPLAGVVSLREGVWYVCVRPAGDIDESRLVPVPLSPALLPELPPRRVVGHRGFVLGATSGDRANLVVHRDLDDDERGPYHQRRLRRDVYTAGRSEPLRDIVLYKSFGGRQYSDNPRAIHEELVRRGAPFEHVWSVLDGMCEVPETALAVRQGSREYHDVMARARYVVFNDHFPNWFVRREDQIALQTWHGTPLKKLGLDVSVQRKSVRRFEQRWDQHVHNWQYVLSPNAFTTPILKRAYGVGGEMLELGYPRNDVLAAPGREERTRALRARLGLAEGVRTVLYAPTYRDQMLDLRGRHRLDLHLDLARLRAALGDDTVVLFRKHHYVVDAVPITDDGFVRDVSSYPDGTELMLAADVLVTDYSSMMFDFANTGRPMLFFTYDLDTYADEIRGFYFDFTEAAPGPLLRTTDELAAALNDLDAIRAQYAERYAAFARRFCELDDGHAAARVVERLFRW